VRWSNVFVWLWIFCRHAGCRWYWYVCYFNNKLSLQCRFTHWYLFIDKTNDKSICSVYQIQWDTLVIEIEIRIGHKRSFGELVWTNNYNNWYFDLQIFVQITQALLTSRDCNTDNCAKCDREWIYFTDFKKGWSRKSIVRWIEIQLMCLMWWK